MPRMILLLLAIFVSFPNVAPVAHAEEESAERRFVQLTAKTREDRSKIANLGLSIEAVRSDSVWAITDLASLARARAAGIQVLGNYDISVARGGHQGAFDFPSRDSRFHNYDETLAELRALESANPDLCAVSSIGKSVEGRDIWALHINSSANDRAQQGSFKPGVIIMGAHHAREHLSVEVPLMFVRHLMEQRKSPQVQALLESRDIWVLPMINPDGAEHDIATGRYRSWRKNRLNNGDGTYGVDLNRNYGFKWGTGGSSDDTGSDVYMGKTPFSEPETRAVRDFVSAHTNAKVLLTVHTFSELILYPWGHKYDSIENARDLQVFETMARTMAGWNHYTPQQSSDLYIASGDTTDWAYGELGIFAFTFELSPRSIFDGGFYPGAGVIDRVFQDNLRPLMYLLDVADDPYKVLDKKPSGWLPALVEPRV